MVMRQQNKRVVQGMLTVLALIVVFASGDFHEPHALNNVDGADNMNIFDGKANE